PEFVMSVGDLIEGYTEDEVEIDRQWEEFDGFIDELEMPFFYVPGNHDYTNPVMARKWEERLGPSYYHFVYKDVLFLAINSERAVASGGKNTYVDDKQYEYVKQALADNPDVRWTLVFTHKPMWIHENTGKWPDIEALLKDRKHTVFAGHHHRYVKYERNNGKYFMLATTGGGSGLRGPSLGEFDHVVWATMTDRGPILANLMLEGIWGEDVFTKEQWDFVGPLRSAQPIRVSPILVDEPTFNSGTLQVRLTNDSDVPMQVYMEIEDYLDVRPDRDQLEKLVPPNSVEMVQVPLKAQLVSSIDEMVPLTLHTTCIYQKDSLPDLELKFRHVVRPLLPMVIPTVSKEITVDGAIGEWESLPFKFSETYMQADPFSHKGAEDIKVAFGIAQGPEHVYLAIHVEDDELLIDESRSYWQQDGLAIQIQAGPLEQSANDQEGWGGIYLVQNPPSKPGQGGRTYQMDRLPKGIQTSLTQVEGGFISELALPTSLIDSLQGTDWKYLRVNIAAVDFDQDYTHDTRLFWQPAWNSEENFVGSGLFVRKKEEQPEKSGKRR
ncbi:MAG: metallophosphoesterase, partial [Bacteroidota bacterium]